MGLDIYFFKHSINDRQVEQIESTRDKIVSLETKLDTWISDHKKFGADQAPVEVIDTLQTLYEVTPLIKQGITDPLTLRTFDEAKNKLHSFDPDGILEQQVETEVLPLLSAINEEKTHLNTLRDPRVEVAYFRKVNFLLPFFNYYDNCSYKKISMLDVEELLRRCRLVLDAKDDEVSERLLPTQDGCFFGGTEYGEYYYSDVLEVLDTFTHILDETDWHTEIIEMYCWW